MRLIASLVPLFLVEIVALTAGYFARFVRDTWETSVPARIRGVYWGWYFGSRRLYVARGVQIEGRSRVRIGSGTKLNAGVQLAAATGFIHIGERNSISRYTTIAGAAGVTVGSDCDISSHVSVFSITSDSEGPRPLANRIKAPVTIGDAVQIGTGVRILPGVTIGDRASVGAGAVVTKDVAERGIAVGIPAKVLRQKDEI